MNVTQHPYHSRLCVTAAGLLDLEHDSGNQGHILLLHLSSQAGWIVPGGNA